MDRRQPDGNYLLCSAITRSCQRGRQQIFVMQAAQHRSGAHREALADPMGGSGGVADGTIADGGSGTPGPSAMCGHPWL
jgi:hypothetical protein